MEKTALIIISFPYPSKNSHNVNKRGLNKRTNRQKRSYKEIEMKLQRDKNEVTSAQIERK